MHIHIPVPTVVLGIEHAECFGADLTARDVVPVRDAHGGGVALLQIGRYLTRLYALRLVQSTVKIT